MHAGVVGCRHGVLIPQNGTSSHLITGHMRPPPVRGPSCRLPRGLQLRNHMQSAAGIPPLPSRFRQQDPTAHCVIVVSVHLPRQQSRLSLHSSSISPPSLRIC